MHVNPSEFLLELVNVDFARNTEEAEERLSTIQTGWAVRARTQTGEELLSGHALDDDSVDTPVHGSLGSKISVPITLLHRNFLKSYRDFVAYGIRIAMYFGASFPYTSRTAAKAFRRSRAHDGYCLAASEW
jgi:hypothetical protein